MENFNAKEYRDSLAKDLKEIRKTDPEKAQAVLGEEQGTTRYKEAKDTHNEEREKAIEERKKEHEKLENIEKRELRLKKISDEIQSLREEENFLRQVNELERVNKEYVALTKETISSVFGNWKGAWMKDINRVEDFVVSNGEIVAIRALGEGGTAQYNRLASFDGDFNEIKEQSEEIKSYYLGEQYVKGGGDVYKKELHFKKILSVEGDSVKILTAANTEKELHLKIKDGVNLSKNKVVILKPSRPSL